MSTYTPTDEQLEQASKCLVEMLPDPNGRAVRSDARIVTLSLVRAILDEAAGATDAVSAGRLVARARAQILALDHWLAAAR